MITLYDAAYALNCCKVRLLLSMLGVPYDRQPVDLRQGQHRTPEMLALNPFGQVPVLRDGAVALRDSGAILVWLARRFGSARWMPRDPDDEAVVNAWLERVRRLEGYVPLV